MDKSGNNAKKKSEETGHGEDRKIIEVNIEVCHSCKKHEWCTRHNEAKYESNYNATAAAIKEICPEVEVFKNKDIKIPSMGAFEIRAGGSLIYSKIQSGLWPAPAAVAQRVKKFIEDYKEGKDVSKYSNISEKKYVPPKKEHTSSNFYSQMGNQESDKKASGQQQNNQPQNQEGENQQKAFEPEVQKPRKTFQNQQENQQENQSNNDKKQSAGRLSQSEVATQNTGQQKRVLPSSVPEKVIISPTGAVLKKDDDTVGKMDPYCAVHLGSDRQKTPVHENGGLTPVWNNPMSFAWKGENKVRVEIWEKDTFTKDDLLGSGFFELPTGNNIKYGQQNIEVTILNEKKEEVGTVKISYAFMEKENFIVRPLRAELKRNTEALGKMDPFCVINLGSQTRRSAVAEDMGQKPTWKDVLGFHRKDEKILKITVLEKDTTSDDTVGEGELQLTEQTGKIQEKVNIFYQEKDAGFVELEIEYTL